MIKTKDKKFGILINGRLFKAPSRYIEGEYQVFTSDPSTHLRHGYKEIVYLDELEENSQVTRFAWTETETQIIQRAINEDLDYDYSEQFKKGFDDFKTELREIKNSISNSSNYCEMLIKKHLKDRYFSNVAYEYLKKKYEGEGLVSIVSKINLRSFDYSFRDLGVYDEIIKCGFRIVTPESEEAIKAELNRLGHTYQRFSVNREAYKIVEGKVYTITPFIVLSPLLHAAKLIDDHEKYSYKSIFCSLHTLLDEFILKIMRFHISMYPKSVINSESVQAASVFAADSLDDIRDQIIDKIIEKYGHMGYADKLEQLNNWGITPSLDEQEFKDSVIVFCEKRNVLVHNAGIINKTFLRKVSSTIFGKSFELGDKLNIDQDELLEAVELIDKVCSNLFDVVTKKFDKLNA